MDNKIVFSHQIITRYKKTKDNNACVFFVVVNITWQMSLFYSIWMPSVTKGVKFKKKLQLTRRNASRETFLCKLKWKISLPLIPSKVEVCVFLEACDSITRGKSVRHVLWESKSQIVCVLVACAKPLIMKHVC